MKVFWLVQSATDLPEDDAWLAAEERARLQSMSVPKRRGDWRLGRWTGKRAIGAAWRALPVGLKSPEQTSCVIRSAPDGAPEVYVGDARAPLTVSISHSAGLGLCAVAAGRVAMGCDIEEVARRSDRFVEDYFTASERAIVGGAPNAIQPLAATLIWSAKESALKALREGLRMDTRAVEVSLEGSLTENRAADEWCPLLVGRGKKEGLFGLWQTYGRFVVTVAAELEPEMVPCRHEWGPPL